METPEGLIKSMLESAETYTKTTIELSKLKLLETTIRLATSFIPKMSVIFMMLLFTLVFNIGIALWIGELLGQSYIGFFIVAGFYFIAGIVLHFFLYKWVKKPISDFIIEQALQ